MTQEQAPHHWTEAQNNTLIADRRAKVSALVLARVPYARVAEQLDCSVGTVSNDVKALRKAWRENAGSEFADHVAQHLAEIEALMGVVFRDALGTDNGKPRLRSIDRAMALLDRKAKLLGLNAPEKIEIAMRVETMAKALESTLIELGQDPVEARPILSRTLRELEAASQS